MANATPLLSQSELSQPLSPSSSIESETPSVEKVLPSLDEFIEQSIGGFAWAQLLHAILVSLAWLFDGQQTFISIFTDAEPTWHCNHLSTEDCNSGLPATSFFMGCLLDPTPLLSQSHLADPEPMLIPKHLPSLDETFERYIGDFGWAQLLQAFLVSFAWVFDAQQTFISLFTDAEPPWHCTELGTELCTSVSNICQLPKGSWAWDRAADTSIVSEWTLVCAGILTIFSPNVWIYSGFRFLSGFGRATIGTCAIVLSTELVGKRWRSQVGVCVHFFVRESPRWLLVRGRKEEAVATLKSIGAVNNIGFGVGMVYYGMPLALGNLPFNLYWNVTFNALSELPASLIAFFFIERLNRKSSVLVFTMTSGVCSIMCVVMGEEWASLKIGLELVSFFSTCTAFDILLIYTIELFPTCVRNSAMAMVRQALVFGGVFCPVIVEIGMGNGYLSYGVFGVVIISCGLFVGCLPETKGGTLCDTMEEEENKERAAHLHHPTHKHKHKLTYMADSTPLLSQSHPADPEPLLIPKHLPSLDETFERYIGDFGWAQLLQAFLVSFAWVFDAQQTFISVFTDAEPPWHCTELGTELCTSSLPASSFFTGCMVGGLVLATLADSSFGRKNMLFFSCLLMSATGILTIFSPNVWIYSGFRFLSGFGRATIGTCAIVLSTELVGKRWRSQVGVFHFFVRESPRWLLVRGRKEEAVATLKSIGAVNNIGFGVGMVYYGMPLALGNLPFNLYWNVTFNALSELPASLIAFFFIERLNRKSSVLVFTMTSGVCSIMCVVMGEEWASLKIGLELVSFFSTCTAFDILLIYTIELFPTCVRNSAMAMVRQALVFGGVFCPVIVEIGRGNGYLSYGVFGVVIISCGLFEKYSPNSNTLGSNQHIGRKAGPSSPRLSHNLQNRASMGCPSLGTSPVFVIRFVRVG
ncbi:unnamed protein product, partial [Vitis vinifera]